MNLEESARETVRQATVKLTKKGGQGVLVPGGFILTAAHCVEWRSEGTMMAVGGHFIEEIGTVDGESLRVRPFALEPVLDIALLGPLDNQEFSDEADAFELFCERTRPVLVRTDEPERSTKFPAFILSHLGPWIKADAQLLRDGEPTLFLESGRIERGTSGGPVVDAHGHLLGVVSHGGHTRGDKTDSGNTPRPHRALPAWAWEAIAQAQAEASPKPEETITHTGSGAI